MLRQIEGVVQYEPMEVQRLSFASYYFIFYKKFYLSVETLLKAMELYLKVLFSLWVSLIIMEMEK